VLFSDYVFLRQQSRQEEQIISRILCECLGGGSRSCDFFSTVSLYKSTNMLSHQCPTGVFHSQYMQFWGMKQCCGLRSDMELANFYGIFE